MVTPIKSTTVFLAGVLVFAVAGPDRAQSENAPSPPLQQLVAELGINPGDSALREKVIRLALETKPAPPVPEEALMHEGAAEYVFKSAKAPADFAEAAAEYEKALLAAPWVAADYFNCGVAYEKADKPEPALRNFKLYLLAAPDANDAVEVRKHVGALQFMVDKAAKEQAEREARLAKERAEKEAEEDAAAERLARQFDVQQQQQAEAAAKLKARRDAGLAGLAGTWRHVSSEGFLGKHPVDDPYEMHVDIEMRGRELIVTCVRDKDAFNAGLGLSWLKGERTEWYRLNRIMDRRIFGRDSRRKAISGVISDDWNEIRFETMTTAQEPTPFFITVRREE